MVNQKSSRQKAVHSTVSIKNNVMPYGHKKVIAYKADAWIGWMQYTVCFVQQKENCINSGATSQTDLVGVDKA